MNQTLANVLWITRPSSIDSPCILTPHPPPPGTSAFGDAPPRAALKDVRRFFLVHYGLPPWSALLTIKSPWVPLGPPSMTLQPSTVFEGRQWVCWHS